MRQVKVCESLTLGGEGGFGGVQEVGLPHRHGIGAWVGGEEGGNMAFHMLEGGRYGFQVGVQGLAEPGGA
jgi:hypothetical protein